MLVISALKQVANAATNAVHSATGNVTGHAHGNSGESIRFLFHFWNLNASTIFPRPTLFTSYTLQSILISTLLSLVDEARLMASKYAIFLNDNFYDKLKLSEYL